MKDYIQKREIMVSIQIEARGISNKKVLEAMKEIPRHLFIAKENQKRAYCDEPLPIGEQQTISQPYIVAYMSEALNLKQGEKVLEIGTGSGYQTAVLSHLTKKVFTVELIESLSLKAQKTLNNIGCGNIQYKIGDGTYGWKENSPFDAIIVTAAPSVIPERLVSQLKIGGRMIIPVGDFHQELILIEKKTNGIRKKKLLPVRFVPLISTQ